MVSPNDLSWLSGDRVRFGSREFLVDARPESPTTTPQLFLVPGHNVSVELAEQYPRGARAGRGVGVTAPPDETKARGPPDVFPPPFQAEHERSCATLMVSLVHGQPSRGGGRSVSLLPTSYPNSPGAGHSHPISWPPTRCICTPSACATRHERTPRPTTGSARPTTVDAGPHPTPEQVTTRRQEIEAVRRNLEREEAELDMSLEPQARKKAREV